MIYEFTLLSKFKLPASLSDTDVLNRFKHQFESAVPLNHVDCVFVTGLADHSSNDMEHMKATTGSLHP